MVACGLIFGTAIPSYVLSKTKYELDLHFLAFSVGATKKKIIYQKMLFVQ